QNFNPRQHQQNFGHHPVQNSLLPSSDDVNFIYLMIKDLCNNPDFYSSVVDLSKNLNVNYDHAVDTIKNNPGIFETFKSKSSNILKVKIFPNIKFCNDYLGSGCMRKKCPNIHICKEFVKRNCYEGDSCVFGHSWQTNHNEFVLKMFCLNKISNKILNKLMQKLLCGTQSPQICNEYQVQNCQRKNCNDLHICQLYVTSLGKCSNLDKCLCNHNIFEPKCKLVLESFGIDTNDSPRDVIKDLLQKLSKTDTKSIDLQNLQITDKNSPNPDQGGKNKQKNNPENVISSKHVNIIRTSRLKGNVDIPLICYQGIDNECKYMEKECKLLHSKTSYYWQFKDKNDWYNFHSYHSEILERNFRNVDCDDVALPKLNEEKVNVGIKYLLTILGVQNIKADFLTMTIDCEGPGKVYPIRHVTTASSVTCNTKHSTTFNWYFKDDHNKWILFGNSDASSSTIETAYQKNMTGTTIITSSNTFKYQIDFSNMTQTNLSTNKVRPIRRRPASSPVVVKKEALTFPKTWESMDGDEEYKLVKLSSTSEDFKNVRQLVQTTLPMSNIVSIFQLQNPHLWKQFINKQASLKKKYQTDFVNIAQLFCGVDDNHLTDIYRDNIDWRLHNQGASTPFGNGTYFYLSAASGIAKVKPDFLGVKNVLVANVILGKVTPGSAKLTRPPVNPSTNDLYDTTTDSATSPSLFVKFDKQEYYPSFLVKLKD
ncbi:UNVERIFIED_CONTAM: hypothetical protein GTU68_036608, partial [Idotea baltica]|nr:hypothetical protein [Idotea baltica]